MKYFITLLLFLPLAVLAQKENVYKIDSTIEYIPFHLSQSLKHTIADNPGFANPDFNDAAWEEYHDVAQLSANRKVEWFRFKFIVDSSVNKDIIMRINQTGASEIYLNGKLIQQLGRINLNPDSAVFYNPNLQALSLPVFSHTPQVLAIRFLNMPEKYPLYQPYKSSFAIWATCPDAPSDKFISADQESLSNKLLMVTGIMFFLFALYLAFYFFFTAQKINLYFSLSCLFYAINLLIQYVSIYYSGKMFILGIAGGIFSSLYFILVVYSIYKTLVQRLDWFYRCLIFLCVAGIAASYLINSGNTSGLAGCFTILVVIRISIISIRNGNKGAWILLISNIISLLFWMVGLLALTGIINIPGFETYIPYAYLLQPVTLAIYLGYSFGVTSQSLRKKLAEVELLSNEKQLILSAQNEVLEKQVSERTAALNQSLQELKSTQQQLIQSEKMASLGELTAGIAHEIQNPLNFVNNFSEVNNELIEELKAERSTLNAKEQDELLNDIFQNNEKIAMHGKRADAIVKGMLQHSRQSSGKKEPTNINALCDEYLRLSYHGLRAKDKNFNADFKTDFDESIDKINVVPQDIGRVLLNLFNNAFYAVKPPNPLKGEQWKPLITVTTKKIKLADTNIVTNSPLGAGGIEIVITDNGNGIPQNIIDKIFQPFFTTKPTGQGTGLGLSLAYDIITKEHKGTIKVNSKEGEGTEFIIHLPVM